MEVTHFKPVHILTISSIADYLASRDKILTFEKLGRETACFVLHYKTLKLTDTKGVSKRKNKTCWRKKNIVKGMAFPH